MAKHEYSGFTLLCLADKLPAPEREYRFHATRRWRFDFAWPAEKIALEVDGGSWTGGRHTRGPGFEMDQQKSNAATLLGWRVLHVTPERMRDGSAVRLVALAISGDASMEDVA